MGRRIEQVNYGEAPECGGVVWCVSSDHMTTLGRWSAWQLHGSRLSCPCIERYVLMRPFVWLSHVSEVLFAQLVVVHLYPLYCARPYAPIMHTRDARYIIYTIACVIASAIIEGYTRQYTRPLFHILVCVIPETYFQYSVGVCTSTQLCEFAIRHPIMCSTIPEQ